MAQRVEDNKVREYVLVPMLKFQQMSTTKNSLPEDPNPSSESDVNGTAAAYTPSNHSHRDMPRPIEDEHQSGRPGTDQMRQDLLDAPTEKIDLPSDSNRLTKDSGDTQEDVGDTDKVSTDSKKDVIISHKDDGDTGKYINDTYEDIEHDRRKPSLLDPRDIPRQKSGETEIDLDNIEHSLPSKLGNNGGTKRKGGTSLSDRRKRLNDKWLSL